MSGFETSQNVQPHEEKADEQSRVNVKFGLNRTLAAMIVLLVLLCANQFILLDTYADVKEKLDCANSVILLEQQEKQEIADVDNNLKKTTDQLALENRKLKEENGKVSRGSTDLTGQLDTLKKQNRELSKKNQDLSKQNKTLVDDNVALQNSLKMAASAGVKPQNYSVFDGLEPRDLLNRGKYIGNFLGTAYTPSKEECGNDRGITRSGKAIMPGVSIAVDNSYWPFGTVFYIKGLGYTVAMDTGSGVKGKYRFDFSVFDRTFAKELGTRKWEVYLVRLGKGYVGNIAL